MRKTAGVNRRKGSQQERKAGVNHTQSLPTEPQNRRDPNAQRRVKPAHAAQNNPLAHRPCAGATTGQTQRRAGAQFTRVRLMITHRRVSADNHLKVEAALRPPRQRGQAP